MPSWIDRFLAAVGMGDRKAEADVSYDPALVRNTAGGEPGPGGSDLKEDSDGKDDATDRE